MLLLYLDDFHAGDPLFLADLGRRLARSESLRALVVHDSSDAVDRAVENAPEEEHGLLIERAVRQTNQSVVRRLIEEGVAAVSVQGCDRGLVKLREGRLRLGKTSWLAGAITRPSIPVISGLARRADSEIVAVDAARLATLLAHKLSRSGDLEIVTFTQNRKGGLYAEGDKLGRVLAANLEPFSEIVDVDALRKLTDAGSVVVTNSAGLEGDHFDGTLVTKDEPT